MPRDNDKTNKGARGAGRGRPPGGGKSGGKAGGKGIGKGDARGPRRGEKPPGRASGTGKPGRASAAEKPGRGAKSGGFRRDFADRPSGGYRSAAGSSGADRSKRGAESERDFGARDRGERKYGTRKHDERKYGERQPRERSGQRGFARGDERAAPQSGSREPRAESQRPPMRKRDFDRERLRTDLGGERPDWTPRGERQREERPRGERPYRARTPQDRPFGKGPRPDRDNRERPARAGGDRKFGDRTFRDGERTDRPRGKRSFSDRPRERNFDDRPPRGRSSGEGSRDARGAGPFKRDERRQRDDAPRKFERKSDRTFERNSEQRSERAPKREFERKPRGEFSRAPSREAPPPRRADKTGERIARVLARAGLCSRRDAESWIAEGRVAVNGRVISSPALDVTPQDRVTVDGAPLPEREHTRLFLFHKPRGLVTTHADPEGRPTVFDALPDGLPRVISVGRLDFNTEGLLLLTNDGGLTRALELPQTGWLRRYRVRAHGEVTQDRLDALRDGITVEGVRYGEIEAKLERVQGDNVWLSFAMREGKNREVRNVLGALGLEVNRLIRVSYGPFQLGELQEGAVEEVPSRVLRDQLGEKLVALSGAEFAAPASPRGEGEGEKRHARDERGRETRAGLIADRKGRRVLVQRTEKVERDEFAARPYGGPRKARPYHGKKDRPSGKPPRGRKD